MHQHACKPSTCPRPCGVLQRPHFLPNVRPSSVAQTAHCVRIILRPMRLGAAFSWFLWCSVFAQPRTTLVAQEPLPRSREHSSERSPREPSPRTTQISGAARERGHCAGASGEGETNRHQMSPSWQQPYHKLPHVMCAQCFLSLNITSPARRRRRRPTKKRKTRTTTRHPRRRPAARPCFEPYQSQNHIARRREYSLGARHLSSPRQWRRPGPC